MKVVFDRVTFSYKHEPALKDVSCELDAGKTTLVAGHNGSGKSTFLKLMSGIVKPDSGNVILGSTSTADKRTSELARSCALSFQNPDDQLFAQSVEKELRFGIENIGGENSLLPRITETLRLQSLLKENPYSLIYSSRRLVAIACTAVMDTPVIAFDEPTAGLSIREKKYFGDLVAFLRERGKTIAIVTHDLDFLLPYSDNLLMLSNGEIMFSGSKDELFGNAKSRKIMGKCGITFPVYARISSALGLEKAALDAREIADGIEKKRAGATLRTNGQHQLEGA